MASKNSSFTLYHIICLQLHDYLMEYTTYTLHDKDPDKKECVCVKHDLNVKAAQVMLCRETRLFKLTQY